MRGVRCVQGQKSTGAYWEERGEGYVRMTLSPSPLPSPTLPLFLLSLPPSLSLSLPPSPPPSLSLSISLSLSTCSNSGVLSRGGESHFVGKHVTEEDGKAEHNHHQTRPQLHGTTKDWVCPSHQSLQLLQLLQQCPERTTITITTITITTNVTLPVLCLQVLHFLL